MTTHSDLTAAKLHAIMAPVYGAVPEGLYYRNAEFGWFGSDDSVRSPEEAERLCIAELVVRLGQVASVTCDIRKEASSVYIFDRDDNDSTFDGDTLLEALALAYAAVKGGER